MNTKKAMLKVRANPRVIVAYMDMQSGPFCIRCAVKKHPEILSDPECDKDDVWYPIFEDVEEMADMHGERCYGDFKAIPHYVLSGRKIPAKALAKSRKRSQDAWRNR